jgi:hypothetical protein
MKNEVIVYKLGTIARHKPIKKMIGKNLHLFICARSFQLYITLVWSFAVLYGIHLLSIRFHSFSSFSVDSF